MYFPVADIHCHPLVPFAAAALIAFFTSMGGVSGAVVLLPFQMSVLGYTGPGVSATNQIFNILACPAGVWRYWKEGRLLWPLAVIIAGGTLPGVFLGAFVRLRWLPDASRFKLFAAAVLLFVGGRMLLASRKKRGGMKGRPDGGAGTLTGRGILPGEIPVAGVVGTGPVQPFDALENQFDRRLHPRRPEHLHNLPVDLFG
ncbi:MAG: sulfite exporter TauE/SafE family protein, partial [Mailhella sp.]|nr:sulfite exporter TauE/SafE family protein [Mailhella sp.]